LWDLDLAFADVVATSTDPALGAIRLAWWRERLEELDQGTSAPAEPRLQAVQAFLLPNGVTGAGLSQLEDGWLPMLAPLPWSEAQADGLKLRGRTLFGTGARLLGQEPEDAGSAGEIWSLVDGAVHCSDEASRDLLLDEARTALRHLPTRSSRRLRPLTVLGAIAATNLPSRKSPPSGVRRLAAALKHSICGTYPR
jgi:phytoene synthase